jgi:antitoxin HicB
MHCARRPIVLKRLSQAACAEETRFRFRRDRRGETLIDVPALTAAKAALYVTMKRAGVGSSQLARKLGWDAKEISRLLDPRHAARQATRLSKIEKALSMLGKRLVIAVDEAA